MTAQTLTRQLEKMSTENLCDELDKIQSEFWRIAGRTEG